MEINKRDDIFIIWGNGVNHLEEIVNIIREEYKIFFIIKHKIDDMDSFIKNIYKCDSVPWSHLVAKSRYLLKSPKYCFSVYVENENPQEKYYGAGVFRHIQCARIKSTKEKVRNKFNPKHSNGQRTEEHVIHGTDYEEQVVYLKGLLKIPDKKERYKPTGQNKQTVCIEKLYCNILGKGIIPIKETPHYHYLKGNKEIYKRYIMRHIGIELIHDHLCGSYDKLIREFDVEKSDGIIVRPHDNSFLVEDGLHRLCILLNRNYTDWNVYLC